MKVICKTRVNPSNNIVMKGVTKGKIYFVTSEYIYDGITFYEINDDEGNIKHYTSFIFQNIEEYRNNKIKSLGI